MPLATMVIDELSVSPRGGRAGDQVTVPGSGFGSIAGIVRFDPLGENVQAAIVSWAPNLVVFTVPALVASNRTVTVQIENVTSDDSVSMLFWYPSTPGVAPGYQWPNAEAGTSQDIDDPRTATAADFNRILDLSVLGAGEVVKLSSSVPLAENVAVALVDASAGPVTITLPLIAATARRRRIIKKIDATANAVTVARNGANIEGVAADFLLPDPLDAVELAATAADGWWVVGRIG